MMENNPILSVVNITKTYPGVIALRDVSIDFAKGEVHAIVGENGAGKSTLIKAISGAISVDSGEIYFDNVLQKTGSPLERRKLGIEVIYQEFNLIPELSIAENIFMGNFPGGSFTVDKQKIMNDARELLDELGLHELRAETLVKNLSVAYMQMIEISKAVARDAKVIIMDEPTAPLTTNEVKILYKIIEDLKRNGATIIYISHRLEEVFDLADRVTILRDGEKIKTLDIKDTNRYELIKMMVNREASETYPQRSGEISDQVVLEVKNLVGKGVSDVSFRLKKGEILGLGGLIGAGRTETARIIFGADPKWSGQIYVEGREVEITSPYSAIKYGIGYVSEDRKNEGAVLGLSVKENIVISILKKISRGLVINKTKEKTIAEKQKEALQIKAPSLNQLVKNLSGGNQQKVVLAKWLASNCKILILDEPTRGIDVGAKQEIYNLMNELVKTGISILMISSEMEELVGMSDRIVVLYEGRVQGTLSKNEFNQEKILSLGSGYGATEVQNEEKD